MKILLAIDSSPVSQQVLEEAMARPWPPNTMFLIVSAVDVGRFAELPALIDDAKRECEKIVKAGAALLAQAKLAGNYGSAYWDRRGASSPNLQRSGVRTSFWSDRIAVAPSADSSSEASHREFCGQRPARLKLCAFPSHSRPHLPPIP